MNLPSAIHPTNGDADYLVDDEQQYYAGQTVNRVTDEPIKSVYTDNVNHGTWTLTGWDKDSATMPQGGDLTFTATWEFTPFLYRIVYHYQSETQPEGVNPPAPKDDYKYNDPYTVEEPASISDPNYTWTFDGWYTNSGFTGEKVAPGTTGNITEDLDFYGRWTSTANKTTYVVEYYIQNPDGTYNTEPTEKTGDLEIAVGRTIDRKTDANKYDGQGYRIDYAEPASMELVASATGTNILKFYYKAIPTLRINKQVNLTTANVGQTLTYTVTVTNDGKLDLKNVVIHDTFDKEGLTGSDFVKNEATGKYDITVGRLAVGESKSYTATYVVTEADAGGRVTNSAMATYDGKDSNSITVITNIRTRFDVKYMLLEGPSGATMPEDTVANHNEQIFVGAAASYTEASKTWTFDGWYTDPDCTPESKVEPRTSYIVTGNVTFYGKLTSTDKMGSYRVDKFYMDKDGNYGEAETGSVISHVVGSYTLTADEQAPKSVQYELDATKDNEITKTIEEGQTTIYELYYKAIPAIKVDKTADKNSYDVGDTIHYTITVSNTGALTLRNIVLTDGFNRENLRFTDPGFTKTEGENEWTITIDELEPGAWVVYHASYDVALDDSGRTLTNSAAVTAGSLSDLVMVQREIGVAPEYDADIVIEKTFRNTRGTSPAETFVFEAYYTDTDGEHILGTQTISFQEKEIPAGDFETTRAGMHLDINKDVYDSLPTEGGAKYFYVREVSGGNREITYDKTRVRAYVLNTMITSLSGDEPVFRPEKIRIISEQTMTLGGDWNNVFYFENTYEKIQPSDNPPAKAGPQLNRDDHVAYIMGYPDGTVHPEGQITRAEACTIFFRLLTEESRNYYFTRTNDYTDVKSTDWYNNAISTLSNAGIVTGYNDGTFRPDQPITRGEMAKIIAGFANLSKGTKTFTDLDGHWSKRYVELAAGNGWISGYPDGSFQPDKKITRAETVTMINRVLERVPAKESRLLSRSIMLTFPDNEPGEWYYIAIQEASNSHEYQRSVYETAGDEMWTKLRENVDWTKLEK